MMKKKAAFPDYMETPQWLTAENVKSG